MTFSKKTKRLGFGERLSGVVSKSGDLVYAYRGRDKVVRVKCITKDKSGFSARVIAEVGGEACVIVGDNNVIRLQGATTLGITKVDY